MYTLMIAMNICSNGAALSGPALAELEARYEAGDQGPLNRFLYHRALWRWSGFASYQYILSRRGGSLRENDLKVRVENRRVSSAFELGGNNSEAVSSAGGPALTIDDYFELIYKALLENPETISVDYHPLYGYPISLAVDLRDQRLAARAEYLTA